LGSKHWKKVTEGHTTSRTFLTVQSCKVASNSLSRCMSGWSLMLKLHHRRYCVLRALLLILLNY